VDLGEVFRVGQGQWQAVGISRFQGQAGLSVRGKALVCRRSQAVARRVMKRGPRRRGEVISKM
jgi:hypothetical protein